MDGERALQRVLGRILSCEKGEREVADDGLGYIIVLVYGQKQQQ
jgi:hypothetical protein